MRVTVQLEPDLARKLAQPKTLARVSPKLLKLLKNLSVSLIPLHPGTEDDVLASYFAVEVPDSVAAAKVVGRLRPFKGVKAAYVKPTDALPL